MARSPVGVRRVRRIGSPGLVRRGWLWWVLAVVAALGGVGVYDLIQTKHSVTRNYPIIGHARFLMEEIRPEIRQYFIESNTEGRPFDRELRDLVYDRAKGKPRRGAVRHPARRQCRRLRVRRALAARQAKPDGPQPRAPGRPAVPSPTTSRC